MVLSVSPNQLNPDPQTLDFGNNKIVTLVGENGSGKSKILEKVFEDYIVNPEVTLVSFTSGQNECFSSIFIRHLNTSRRALIESYMNSRFDDETGQLEERSSALNTFHFDPSWVRLLIFFATTIKPNGRVRDFLSSRNYINTSNDILNDDLSTYIYFRLRILTPYIRKVEAADAKESEDYNYKSIRRSIMHELLEKVATHYEEDFDFTEPTYLKRRRLDTRDALRVFGRDVKAIFTFLLYALTNDTFIEKSSIRIYFQNDLELNALSDGEFQLLSIYALIDLFDSETTLFLFDEIDSHVHYTNTQKLWTFLKTIEGNLLTTTHSADSIISHHPKSIRLVSKGKIEEEMTAEHIFKRLTFLTENDSYKFKVASKFDYIALVEDKFDWFIFTELAKRKVQVYNSDIEKIQVVKCSSGFNVISQTFADSRKKWVVDFVRANGNNIETKHIFFICDRDNLPLPQISPQNGVAVTGLPQNQPMPRYSNNTKTPFILAWKRKEIENYLLSYTLLNIHGILNGINNHLPQAFQITPGNANDNDSVRNLDIKTIMQPLYLKEGFQNIGTHEEGVDFVKLKALISQIPPEEISEDILNMYNFIIAKMTP